MMESHTAVVLGTPPTGLYCSRQMARRRLSRRRFEPANVGFVGGSGLGDEIHSGAGFGASGRSLRLMGTTNCGRYALYVGAFHLRTPYKLPDAPQLRVHFAFPKVSGPHTYVAHRTFYTMDLAK